MHLNLPTSIKKIKKYQSHFFPCIQYMYFFLKSISFFFKKTGESGLRTTLARKDLILKQSNCDSPLFPRSLHGILSTLFFRKREIFYIKTTTIDFPKRNPNFMHHIFYFNNNKKILYINK